MIDLVQQLKTAYPGARLVYLDWFAPPDLRYAVALDPHIDVCVKKHVRRDRTVYGQPTLGDTNLTDCCSRLFGPPLEAIVHSNAHWEPHDCALPPLASGCWRRVIDTALPPPGDCEGVESDTGPRFSHRYLVGPRSAVVLTRSPHQENG